jgi:hypothetical protein
MPQSRVLFVGIVILVFGPQSLLNGQSGGRTSKAFNIEAAARSRVIQAAVSALKAWRDTRHERIRPTTLAAVADFSGPV